MCVGASMRVTENESESEFGTSERPGKLKMKKKLIDICARKSEWV